MTHVAGGLEPPGDELEPADASYTRHRWIQRATVEWVLQADRILMEHGAVQGRTICEYRYQARWRAQSLINRLVELRLHERWELAEHTERYPGKPGGWIWLVEYKGEKS